LVSNADGIADRIGTAGDHQTMLQGASTTKTLITSGASPNGLEVTREQGDTVPLPM
jgi:hypothetical protein